MTGGLPPPDEPPGDPAGIGTRPTSTSGTRRAVSVGLVALGLAALISIGWFSSAPVPTSDARSPARIAGIYDPPRTSIELAMIQGDGQLFAAAATDPLVRRPELIRGGPSAEAYRLQRPLYGWIGWIASGGQRDLVAVALVAVTIASVGLLAFVLARRFESIGADPRLALGTLLLPGVLADLVHVGPEALGCALALAGFVHWRDRPARWPLVLACFAAAGLCRETLLLVPAMLALVTFLRAPGEVRAWVRWAVVPLPWAAWVAFLRVRVGAWPVGMDGGNLRLVPLSGLLEAAPGWSGWQWLTATGLLLATAAALATTRDAALRAVLLAQVGLATVLGAFVWQSWTGAGRLLLPLAAFALLALGERFGVTDPAIDRSEDLGTHRRTAAAARSTSAAVAGSAPGHP